MALLHGADGHTFQSVHPQPRALSTLGLQGNDAVHPDFHGLGLGRSLTVAGLRYLQRKGATSGMLYVDADNVGAVTMYEHLGFAPSRTDVAYHLEPAR